VEFQLIDVAMAELAGKPLWQYFVLDQDRGPVNEVSEDHDKKSQNATGGTQIAVYEGEDGDSEWNFRRPCGRTAAWDEGLVAFLLELQQHMEEKVGLKDIRIVTEHKRSGQIFRGHPNYRSKGVWNDWAMFDWGAGYGKLPGEIWCFADFSDHVGNFNTKFSDCKLGNGVYAIVESASPCPNLTRDHDRLENDSDLFTPYTKDVKSIDKEGNIAQRRFWLADVESIVDPLCVIPDIGNSNKLQYFAESPQREWPTTVCSNGGWKPLIKMTKPK